MSSKIIIIAAVILLIVSFFVLFFIEAKNHNYDYKKNWSVVYFENPGDNSLDFAIENHQGENLEYGYEIFSGDKKIADGRIEISAGERKEVSPILDADSGKITIEVNVKDSKYKIYKDIK